MTSDEKKKLAAEAALELIEPGWVVGIGTGSTTNHFIDGLERYAGKLDGGVASSRASAERLERCGIRLLDLNEVGRLPLYVDGADEATRAGMLIKGGGGALTREKIVAAASDRFVCILDDSKLVDGLGAFPLPIEIVPMARALVSAAIERLGGRATPRKGFVTDNGNLILDVVGLDLSDPAETERALNQIAGTVTNGLFCCRPADQLLVAGDATVERIG